MEWVTEPVGAGGWIAERLSDDSSMHSVVPRGFAAYARIFHPADVRSLPDRAMPTMDEWARMPDAEQQRLSELLEDHPATWADAAAAFGTTMHPLAQWSRIVATPPGADWRTRIAPDGREFTAPDEGRMPPALLAAVATHLVQHTSTPDAGFVGVWEGWGGLLGGHGGNGRAFFEVTDQPVWQDTLRASFENPFRKSAWHPGILSDEISKGKRLELPSRNHVLFAAAPSTFADPEWVLQVPWRDREAEERGFDPDAEPPSILWPSDRAWFLASEIDFDSTIVAGSAEIVEAICADAAIEAFPIPEGAELHWEADRVNR